MRRTSRATSSTRLHRWFLLVLVLTLTGAPLWSQEAGASINGSVLDPSGAPVDGAIITANETATGQSRSITSAGGTYSITALPVGTYTVSLQPCRFSNGSAS